VPVEELPVSVDTPLHPLSPYGASKAAADLAAGQYHEAYGLRAIRVRAFNHVGPGQDARFVLPNVARQIARAEAQGRDAIEVRVGNVDTSRDFIDVRDMVRAYWLLLDRGDPDVVYMACSGHSLPVRRLLEGLARLARIPVTYASDPRLRRDGEQSDLYGSPARLRADTGWTPEIPIDTTLADTLDWWRERVAEEKE
jgi:GDP-4-dehydro-6-deoxy-D-mannose reductase